MAKKSKDSYWKNFVLRGFALDFLTLISVACFCFILVSFSSLQFSEGNLASGGWASGGTENAMGPVGHLVATLLDGAFGWGTLVIIVTLGFLALRFFQEEEFYVSSALEVAAVLLGIVGTTLCSSVLFSFMGLDGGYIGESAYGSLESTVGAAGTLVIIFVLLGTFVPLAVLVSLEELVAFCVRSLRSTTAYSIKGTIHFCRSSLSMISVLYAACVAAFKKIFYFGGMQRKHFRRREDRLLDDEAEQPEPDEEKPRKLKPKKLRKRKLKSRGDQSEDEQLAPKVAPKVVIASREKKRRKKKLSSKRSSRDSTSGSYKLPRLDLLASPNADEDALKMDHRELTQIGKSIEAKLADFNIVGHVTHVHPGPVVTLFEFEPAAGIKVGRIAALQDDLSMSLKASSIRIIAPLPKRGTVGIEVPNRSREVVRLREVLESDELASSSSLLSIPLGKDVYGNPAIADIASMPHLLLAGATGTGKSVCINAILMSLLYRATPEELGLILIDPKILELSVYEAIPHLKVPVVTEPKKARTVLRWGVEEMERRYRLMKRFGVRSIDGYNALVRGEDQSTAIVDDSVIELDEESIVAVGNEVTTEADSKGPDSEERQRRLFSEELERLPKIVIVIDELADLMLTVGKEIEELITRLAQKARAAGIHLIVATQRPSVDVITGLIKANFPARVSFRVSSRIDSRTILDSGGAEKLLGNGDMLFSRPGAMHAQRLHGAFVSDSEVQKVIADIRASSEPVYDEKILEMLEKAEDEEASSSDLDSEEFDPLYDKAVELVLKKRKASTSMIQRAFRIGYNRAARIIEVMEMEGLVGPADGSRPRDVLLDRGEELSASHPE